MQVPTFEARSSTSWVEAIVPRFMPRFATCIDANPATRRHRPVNGGPSREEDLPILVAALDSRDPNTTSLVLRGLGRLKTIPERPRAARRNLIRLARRSGPSMTDNAQPPGESLDRHTQPEERQEFQETLTAWESCLQTGGSQAVRRSPSRHQPSRIPTILPLLTEHVLLVEVMKTASTERGQKVIERAKCLDCHKFGSKGEGLGPDLTTVRSRFRPSEILESIVEPSKVISDQYKPVTIATADGKVYNGMPIVSDGPNMVLLLSDGTKATIPKTEIDAEERIQCFRDA